jgi:hypothetical protein
VVWHAGPGPGSMAGRGAFEVLLCACRPASTCTGLCVTVLCVYARVLLLERRVAAQSYFAVCAWPWPSSFLCVSGFRRAPLFSVRCLLLFLQSSKARDRGSLGLGWNKRCFTSPCPVNTATQ